MILKKLVIGKTWLVDREISLSTLLRKLCFYIKYVNHFKYFYAYFGVKSPVNLVSHSLSPLNYFPFFLNCFYLFPELCLRLLLDLNAARDMCLVSKQRTVVWAYMDQYKSNLNTKWSSWEFNKREQRPKTCWVASKPRTDPLPSPNDNILSLYKAKHVLWQISFITQRRERSAYTFYNWESVKKHR